ncbi:hypothetical protein [Leptolyngbya iicbica]|uniref:Uncharacterized protein n=2 Tax=Cyanophyceae TaxID=3028117 RepID=A0A4Q7E2R0_9CYAN|nr:hypothetical protein [Leptolyngbya sp. LK]RZM76072.1 hypothetical protein DYY88_19465 [Leptolyngbya sp. LK]
MKLIDVGSPPFHQQINKYSCTTRSLEELALATTTPRDRDAAWLNVEQGIKAVIESRKGDLSF